MPGVPHHFQLKCLWQVRQLQECTEICTGRLPTDRKWIELCESSGKQCSVSPNEEPAEELKPAQPTTGERTCLAIGVDIRNEIQRSYLEP